MGGVVTGRWRAPAAWLRGRVMLGAVTAMTIVGLSVFGAAGSAQASTNTQWNVAYKGHAAGLYDVTAISKTDAWTVGTTVAALGSGRSSCTGTARPGSAVPPGICGRHRGDGS